jgi:hypothetical protein
MEASGQSCESSQNRAHQKNKTATAPVQLYKWHS